MKRASWMSAAIISAALALAWTAPAQSLAELAAKEKERRKAQTDGKAKVYTDDDLGGSVPAFEPQAGTSDGAAAGSSASGGSASGKPEKSEDEKHADAERAWRERLAKANKRVEELTAQLADLQTQANYTGGHVYSSLRTQLLGRIEQTKTDLAAAQQQVEDLESEGRRAGFRS